MSFISFKKIGKKFLGANIVELYHCEKSQLKIHFIILIGYTKLTNVQLFKLCSVHHTQIHTFVIFCRDKHITNFWLIFCTLVDFIIIYIKSFCSNFFLETCKYHFLFFFQKRATCSPGAIWPLSLCWPLPSSLQEKTLLVTKSSKSSWRLMCLWGGTSRNQH
jgi:hypothetical protein